MVGLLVAKEHIHYWHSTAQSLQLLSDMLIYKSTEINFPMGLRSPRSENQVCDQQVLLRRLAITSSIGKSCEDRQKPLAPYTLHS